MNKHAFSLHSQYYPTGDQPTAIASLMSGLEQGKKHQILKGITGSGKTFTMANLIARTKRPTLILSHNKVLAAQLYEEMLSFFPDNAVHFFVSYYDYYQPEVYIPQSDRFIRKDTAVNERLERLRLASTKALIERRDSIIIASVSSIYGLGSPEQYRALQIHLDVGQAVALPDLIARLEQNQYQACKDVVKNGSYALNSDGLDIFPADSSHDAIRLTIADGWLESIERINPKTRARLGALDSYTVSPKTLYAVSKQQVERAIPQIKQELELRLETLNQNQQWQEAGRLEERITRDIEQLVTQGYCSGMENYARYFNPREEGSLPTTLLDYLPKDGLLLIDESHVMIPQISTMARSDGARKQTLVDYGFRLPSCHDNRPLTFEEFVKVKPQTVFVSATPGPYELSCTHNQVVPQVIRPTGLLDPLIEVRAKSDQEKNLCHEVAIRIENDERVLVTTLTKARAESLSNQLNDKGVSARFLHSDITTADRVALIKAFRKGEFDVLIGVNLIREGLDIPEVTLVAILDADKAGFLRSESALLQTIGRAARNTKGLAILYADKVTPAMRVAIDETEQRRLIQQEYNLEHGIEPRNPSRTIVEADEPVGPNPLTQHLTTLAQCHELTQVCEEIRVLELKMMQAYEAHKTEEVEQYKQQLQQCYQHMIRV